LLWLFRAELRALLVPAGPAPWRRWERHFRPGCRALLLGRGAAGLPRSVAKLAEARGASVVFSEPAALGQAACFDIVILLGCLDDLPAPDARSLMQQACARVAPGGVLLLRGGAAAPGGVLSWLLRDALAAPVARFLRDALKRLPGGLAHDAAQWVPADMRVEARAPEGLLREVVEIRRLARAPSEVVERLRRLHGNTSMAFCTSSAANRIGVSPEQLRYHVAEGVVPGDAIGYVAFLEQVVLGARLRLVIMDPVCAAADVEATLKSFLAESGAVRARPIFSCVGEQVVEPLRSLGFHTTMLGSEVGIPLANYRLCKDRRRYFRAAPSKGLEVSTECYDLDELEALNNAWVQSKASGSEVIIWTWPPSLPERGAGAAKDPAGSGLAGGEAGGAPPADQEVRRLFAYKDGELVGFVCAEPYYRGNGSGEVLGYGLNTIRFLPRLNPPWTSDYTVASLVQLLQDEGKAEYLAFGLSPFCDVAARTGDLPWLRAAIQLMWSANLEEIYSIQGLAKKKAHHCNRQGVRLQDRFIAGVPWHAPLDTARFLLLLLNGSMVWKVPGGIVKLVTTQVPIAAKHVSNAIKHMFRAMHHCVFF